MTYSALDRPVWNLLAGRQAHLALGDERARRIDPRYGPFAAARDQSPEALAALADLVGPGDEVWLTEDVEWPAPPGLRMDRTLPLTQMLAERPMPMQSGDDGIVTLGEADAAEMTALALATEPGPWRECTRLYGTFYGIRQDGRLAAMAGARMLPAEGLAEVSGVCTLPEFRGRGLAASLIRRVMAEFTARGDVPFLHSYSHNTGAIALYRKLGFEVRCEIVGMVLKRD